MRQNNEEIFTARKDNGDYQIMVKQYFQAIRNKTQIEKLGKEYGFRDLLSLEKFIMDFEVYGHIKEVIQDSVVKGGMAVPFHLQDPTLRRLSVDIDIVTSLSREQTMKRMKKISEKLSDIISIDEPHVPKKPKEKELPLLTYYCNYKSSLNENPEIKIDIFHENRMDLKTRQINKNFKIIGFDLPFPISIYDRGTLIGDKLTTLPSNTIGIKSKRKSDIPKQIYDIATLIKTTQGIFPMEEIINAFKKISKDEISYFTNNKPSFDEILNDIKNFHVGILQIQDSIKLDKSYEGRFNKFKTELLGSRNYPRHIHVADILLIRFIIELLLKKINKNMETKFLIDKSTYALEELDNISKLNRNEKIVEMEKIISKHRKSSKICKVMKSLFVESAFLYDQLLEAEQL